MCFFDGRKLRCRCVTFGYLGEFVLGPRDVLINERIFVVGSVTF
jgi:hypothetical protein